MRVRTIHERVKQQEFVLDEGDLRAAIEAYLRARKDLWFAKPSDASERGDLVFDTNDVTDRIEATYTRIFTISEKVGVAAEREP